MVKGWAQSRDRRNKSWFSLSTPLKFCSAHLVALCMLFATSNSNKSLFVFMQSVFIRWCQTLVKMSQKHIFVAVNFFHIRTSQNAPVSYFHLSIQYANYCCDICIFTTNENVAHQNPLPVESLMLIGYQALPITVKNFFLPTTLFAVS